MWTTRIAMSLYKSFFIPLTSIMLNLTWLFPRLIVIAEKKTVYEKFPTPLINRLEKHFVLTSSVLTEWQLEVLHDFQSWIHQFSSVIGSSGWEIYIFKEATLYNYGYIQLQHVYGCMYLYYSIMTADLHNHWHLHPPLQGSEFYRSGCIHWVPKWHPSSSGVSGYPPTWGRRPGSLSSEVGEDRIS